jgi:VWFA-related protein
MHIRLEYLSWTLLGLSAVTWTTPAVGARQQPPIRSGVELVVVDAQVIDRQGSPVASLQPNDFELFIDGKRRKVAAAVLVQYATAGGSTTAKERQEVAAGTERRQFMLAVDEHSFAPGAAMAATRATRRFIDRLQPADLVGLYTIPGGAGSAELTTNHASVHKSLDRVVGKLEPPPTSYNLSKSEIADISSGDADALSRVAARECASGGNSCRRAIYGDAVSLAGYLEAQIAASLSGLRGLIRGLASVSGRKTLVLVSGGLFASDRGGGRVNMGSEIRELGREAAQANITLYALHMDSSFIDAFATRPGITPTLFRDGNALAAGLENIAGAAGGAVFRVQAGNGDSAFDRVLRENSAYYLLSVEVEPQDRDGRAHAIKVQVNQRGATVRSRAVVVVPRRQAL